MTTCSTNPTRAWSRNTIHTLFPLASTGAGIIIGAGSGGRCSLTKDAAQARQAWRPQRGTGGNHRYPGPEPSPRGRRRGSLGKIGRASCRERV